MPFKDLLKKKERVSSDETPPSATQRPSHIPEFIFVRSETTTEEIIKPPTFPGDSESANASSSDAPTTPPRRTLGRLHKGSSASAASPDSQKDARRLSNRLHLISKSRASSTSSVNVPSDLPAINDAYTEHGDKQEKEAKWEERATILAKENATVHVSPPVETLSEMSISGAPGGPSRRSMNRAQSMSDAVSDENIQEAIRLHEAGDLVNATRMFGRLAENGNVLSQVLYGLSLRHGWGCTPDPARAVTYLSAAASNSASIESEALKSGMKKGGAAKGELVLAIFELANCFRNGWGVEVDKVAARQYYETAANLGDTDAMNEAAWCYLNGFGGKKDKVCVQRFLQVIFQETTHATSLRATPPETGLFLFHQRTSTTTFTWLQEPQQYQEHQYHNTHRPPVS
jgi:TPR repeat protein